MKTADSKQNIRNKQEELILIKEASCGNKESFQELQQRYKSAIRGYIAGRCFPGLARITRGAKEKDVDQRIKEIEQNAWIEVWVKIPSYEPGKSSFYRFVCIWADYMIKRYYSRKEKREIPLSVLNAGSQSDEEKSPAEVLDGIIFSEDDFSHDEYLEKCREFLKITFSEGGAVHQLEVFGFNKLVSGWGPKDIVIKLSPSLLKDLCRQLISSYKAESCLPGYIVDDCFLPLAQKMQDKVGEALEDENSRRAYVDLLELKSGDTVLKAYFGKDPEHNISDWSDKVKNRVLRLIK